MTPVMRLRTTLGHLDDWVEENGGDAEYMSRAVRVGGVGYTIHLSLLFGELYYLQILGGNGFGFSDDVKIGEALDIAAAQIVYDRLGSPCQLEFQEEPWVLGEHEVIDYDGVIGEASQHVTRL